MMLIFSAGYCFIKLRFFLASIAGWITLLVFNIGAIIYSPASGIQLINSNFFFISANLIGMIAAYNIEYYTRRNFFLNYELDSEKNLVKSINNNLEKTVQDRTNELQIAKERAEESDRLKSAFLANMSHEIRTPMNGILGFAELLKEPGLTGDQQQEYIRIIETSGARMLNIINDIVSISKIESGTLEVSNIESNINHQMEYIYDFFKPEAEAKGLKLSFINSLPAKNAIIRTDREKVFAILTNLVKNAIKYTLKGSIEFGYLKKDDFLEFYVKDTGMGVPKHRQEAIFERFVQADIEDKMALQGAGLGLAITKSYVEMLGGKIWVESEEGLGSTFYFTLPHNNLPSKRSECENVDPLDIKDSNANKLKILIVEDDETSEKLISINVTDISNEVIKARNGIQGVEICRNKPDIDLILMDIQMPLLNGYEATRQIRQFNNEVIIIAQTSFGLSGDREKAITAGCNEYLTKPISKSRLYALIQKYFNI
ncbi:MAG: ATP-binding protein [Bacteroidales bacterium]